MRKFEKSWYRIFREAKELGIPRQKAVDLRVAYLTKRLPKYDDFAVKENLTGEVARKWRKDILDEIKFLNKNRDEPICSKDQITAEQIQTAKQYPIEKIVEFNNVRKIKAWCHDDKNPSMYIMSHVNRLCCPVCNKTFDTIDTVMELRGLSFPEAVRSLL